MAGKRKSVRGGGHILGLLSGRKKTAGFSAAAPMEIDGDPVSTRSRGQLRPRPFIVGEGAWSSTFMRIMDVLSLSSSQYDFIDTQSLKQDTPPAKRLRSDDDNTRVPAEKEATPVVGKRSTHVTPSSSRVKTCE